MILLTIETATPLESIALVDGGRVLGVSVCRAGRGRSDELLARVADVLDASSLRLSDLDGVAVSIGPGRFTGLRVGLATAKGLAASTGLPVVPVHTLEALALSAARSSGAGPELVAPMLDARRGEVYGALFIRESGRGANERSEAGVRRVTPDVAEPPLVFLRGALQASGGSQVLLAGTGASLYRDELERDAGGLALFAGEGSDRPSPTAMAALAERAAANGVEDAASLSPLYLRGI